MAEKRKRKKAIEGEIVRIEEQEAQGLRPQRRPSDWGSYVAPEPKAQVVRLPAGELNQVDHTLNVPLNATQHIEMKTSHVDRAKGQLISSVPLFFLIGFAIDLLAYQFVDYPFLSIPSILIITGVAACCWAGTWLYSLSISAEGVSKYEAKQKWGVIKEEQRRRWNHYDRMSGEE